MPGRDGTGPMGSGPMTGGRRGWCAGEAVGAGRGVVAPRGGGMGRGRGGGGGRRNQFYETGLTGWQRATRADTAAAEQADPLVRIESALTGVLERLESAGQR